MLANSDYALRTGGYDPRTEEALAFLEDSEHERMAECVFIQLPLLR
jgi:hypothetical protein